MGILKKRFPPNLRFMKRKVRILWTITGQGVKQDRIVRQREGSSRSRIFLIKVSKLGM